MSTDDLQLGGGGESGNPPPVPEESDNDELAKRYPVGFTDYPFSDVGDVPGEKAPIRLCWIVGWDRNKYATIQVVGIEHLQQVKYGYIYKAPGRLGEVESYTVAELDELLRDNCEVCKGEKGGMLGNENIVRGIRMCDYCHASERNGLQ